MKLDEIYISGKGQGRKPITVEDLKAAFRSVLQDFANATIKVEPYNSPSFRASQIRNAITKLERVASRLETEGVISKAYTSANKDQLLPEEY